MSSAAQLICFRPGKSHPANPCHMSTVFQETEKLSAIYQLPCPPLAKAGGMQCIVGQT